MVINKLDDLSLFSVVRVAKSSGEVEIRQLFSDEGLIESNNYYLLETGQQFHWHGQTMPASYAGNRIERRVGNGVLYGMSCSVSEVIAPGLHLATESTSLGPQNVFRGKASVSVGTNFIGQLAAFERFRMKEQCSTRRHKIEDELLRNLGVSMKIGPNCLVGVRSGTSIGALLVLEATDNQLVVDYIFASPPSEIKGRVLHTIAVCQGREITFTLGQIDFL